MKRSLALLLTLPSAALLPFLGGCIQDESAPNRLGMERPALLPNDSRAAESANKRALETPQRNLPTSGAEFPGQSLLLPAVPSQVLTLDAAETPVTPPAPAPINKINDHKNLAAPGHDIPVPGTNLFIDKTWGQVYPLPAYPHRDWAPVVVTYQSGITRSNPWYFNTIWDRPDYQPNHPYGNCAEIGADVLEIPYSVAQDFALPFMMLFKCPFSLKTTVFPSTDPNYNRYLPVTSNLVPAPYLGTFQFEAATQPTTAPAGDQNTLSTELPAVPVLP